MTDLATLGIRVDSRGFITAKNDMRGFEGQAGRVEKSAGAMSKSIKAAGLAAAAAFGAMASFGAVVSTIRDYETSMSKLGAVTRATGGELLSMRKIAGQLGATTEFSAKQAADGLTFLGMAGFSAAESIAAIPSVLDLATASGMGLARSADIASNVLSGFGIAADKAGTAADILAAASSRSNTTVEQLGSAMSTVAPIAAALGVDMADTAAAIGTLSDAGIQGERAGTALRGVMAALAGPTAAAESAFSALGLTVAELDPATNSLSTIMDRLGDAGLTTAQAMTIFGREAASGALVLVDGAKRLGEFGSELRSVDGEAARMADTIRDNLGGDMNTLVSTTQGLMLAMGEAGLTEVLRFVVQGLTSLVRGVSLAVEVIGAIIGVADSARRALFGLGEGSDGVARATDAVERNIRREISAVSDLSGVIAPGTVLSLDAAQAKLEEAKAIQAKISAAIDEQEQIIRSGAAYQELQKQLTFLTSEQDRFKNSARDGGIFAPNAFREGAEKNLDLLLETLRAQRDMLAAAGSTGKAFQENARTIAALEAGIASAKGETVVLAGAMRGSAENAESLRTIISTTDISGLSGQAALLAGNLGVAAGNAAAMNAALNASAGISVPKTGALAAPSSGLSFGIDPVKVDEVGSAILKFGDASSTTRKFVENLSISTKGLTSAIGGGGGGGGGAAGAANSAATEMKSLNAEIEKLEFDADPVKKYNAELSKLKELAANGLSDGAYQKAVRNLGIEFADSIPAVSTFADAIGDFVASGLRNFDDLLGAFKNMIRQMIATAIANPIKLALTGALTGGLGGAASAAGGAASAAGGAAAAGGVGLLGSFGAKGGGLLGGLAGGTGLLGGLGNAVSGGIANIFSIGANAAAAGGGFLATVGAAIPVLGIAAAAFSFFRSKTKELDTGIRVTVDGLDVLVQSFRTVEKSKFWGLSKKVSTTLTDAEASIADPITRAYIGIRDSVTSMAETLNLGTSALDGFAMAVELSTAGMSEDQAVAALQDELTRLANGMAERLIGTFIEITRDVKNTVPDFSDGKISFKEVTETITETSWAAGELAREGETALDTLTRLSSSIVAVNAIMDTLGHTMFDVGLAGGEMASQLADAFGGLDAMNQATGAYYAAFYTEAERIETATRQTTAALADLGIAMPQTRDQYRAMIEAQDLATQGGRETYAALISLSGAFNEILPAVGSFTNEIARMVNVVAADVQGTMISDALQAQRASEQAAGLWYRTSQTLRAFIAELRGTAGALVSGQQAQAFNQARFQALLSSAIAGDSQAAGDLTGAARALLSSSAATAKSSVEQARMEARVISDLQLASGVSDVEGARHDVIAGLLGNQVDLLGEVRDYLNSGGALDPAQLDALNGQLGSLDGAIKAAEMINYAFLKERLEVTVDLLATANLPADVRSLIANAQTGVTGTIDFVVRSDLGPDEKWLALTGASEHIKTIKYVLDDAQWPQEVQDLALTAGGVYRQTIRYIAQNTMPDRLTELALSDVSSLMKSIIFTAKALPPDVRAIVFNEIAPLQKRINFIQGSDLPADQKRLAMADALSFKRVINIISGKLVNGNVRDLALADPSGFTRSLNIIAGLAPSENIQRLALDAAKSFTRVINLKQGSEITPETMRVALISSSDLVRTIRLIAESGISEETRRLALAGNSELTRTVNVALGSKVDQVAMRLALGNLGSYAVAIEAAVSLRSTDAAKRIIFSQAGTYAASITAAISSEMPVAARRILLDQQGQFTTNITGILVQDMPDATRRLLIDANTEGLRAITIAATMADGMQPEAIEALRASGTSVLRNIVAFVNPSNISANGLLFLRQLSDGVATTVGRTIDGKVTLATLTANDQMLLNIEPGTIDRIIAGQVLVGPMTESQRRILFAEPGNIIRVMSAWVSFSVALGHEQKKFLMSDGGIFTRIMRAWVSFPNLGDNQRRFLNSDDGSITKIMRSFVSLQDFNPDKLSMLRAGDKTFTKVLRAKSWFDGFGKDKFKMLRAETETISKTIRGAVDISNLGPRQTSMLDAITGSTAGKITLGGSFIFNPAASFTSWFGSTTRENITSPITGLRGNLTDLANTIREDIASREADQARAAQVALLQSNLAGIASNRGRVVASASSIVDQIKSLEESTGVDLRNGANDAILNVDQMGRINYSASHVAYGPGSDLNAFREAFWAEGGLQSQLTDLIGQPADLLRQMNTLRSQITSLGAVPAYATGTLNHPGGLAMINDGGGGEIVDLPGGARVYPADLSRSMAKSPDKGDAETLAELRQIKAELARMNNRGDQIGPKTVMYLRKISDTQESWDTVGQPPERV